MLILKLALCLIVTLREATNNKGQRGSGLVNYEDKHLEAQGHCCGLNAGEMQSGCLISICFFPNVEETTGMLYSRES